MAIEQLPDPDDSSDEYTREPFFIPSDVCPDNWEPDPLQQVDYNLRQANALRDGKVREYYKPRGRLGNFITRNFLGGEDRQPSIWELVQADKLDRQAKLIFYQAVADLVKEATQIVTTYNLRG